jgi:flavin-dependent dehydrogenase
MNDAYDCIVMGGGPAGATAAALLAAGGCRTLLVEREKFPRYHVGESLMPESYAILQRLGVLEALKRSRQVTKQGIVLIDDSGRRRLPLGFFDVDPRESSQTWQVWRADFDHLLLENARRLGAVCLEETRAGEVLFDAGRAVGVRVQRRDEPWRDIACRVVLDATGSRSLLASSLGIRAPEPRRQHAAIWGYYRGASREAGIHAGSTLLLATRHRQAWFWCVPLHSDITSVGVVADAAYLLQQRGKTEQVFEEELCNCPAVLQRLIDAQLVSPLRVARDFPYMARQAAGEGWVLLGDALGFLDPLFCSGVYLAMQSAQWAADAVLDALRRGDLSAHSLAAWHPAFACGVQRLGRLLDALYTPGSDLLGFLDEHPQHAGLLTELLMGRLFDPRADRMLDDLQRWVQSTPPDAEEPTARA